MIIQELLIENSLQQTECRINVLELLINSETALSEEDIMQKIDRKFNKTSIYRTLNTFKEKGIIHRIITDLNISKYSISKKNMTENHIHFECKKCNSVYCFAEYGINKLTIPEGFENKDSNILIKGICKKCNFNK